MPFYEFSQNNSGGSFRVDDKLCHRLVIEADNEDKATQLAIHLGVYFDGVRQGRDCSCCGDRWSSCKELRLVYEAMKDKKEAQQLAKKYGGAVEKSPQDKYYKYPRFSLTFKDELGYLQYIADTYGWTAPDCRVFYKDGTVKEIFASKGSKPIGGQEIIGKQ
jgi:hypothetical protein